jgi:hypothetical protein
MEKGDRAWRLSTPPVRFCLVSAFAAATLWSATAASAWTQPKTWDLTSQPVSNLTIRAVSAPAAKKSLYPGATANVTVSIDNLNLFNVTIKAVQLPSSGSHATGYTTKTLSSPKQGCSSSAQSGVFWRYSAAGQATWHTLVSPITVAGKGHSNDPLIVTFAEDASMASGTPAACEDTYFKMPSLVGITATRTSLAATKSPANNGWRR